MIAMEPLSFALIRKRLINMLRDLESAPTHDIGFKLGLFTGYTSGLLAAGNIDFDTFMRLHGLSDNVMMHRLPRATA